jgi:chromosome segregation ATPase
MSKRIAGFLFLLVLFGSGLFIGICYGNFKMERQRIDMQGNIDKAGQKAELLQRRYTEQKAIATRFERMQLTLEGQKNKLQKEIENLNEVLISLEREKGLLDDEIKKNVNTLAACEKEKKSIAARNAEFENDRILFAQTKSDYEEKISQMEAEKIEMEAKLRDTIGMVEQRLDICIEKNAKLCILAGELLEMYENKSIVSSILEKEPFLQLKKVELENYVREYQDKIDKNIQTKESTEGN